jgi:putative ABC transport system ATP-binding protein
MLNLHKINLSFGNKHVLKDLSCHVEAGDFIVILGTNGAGKSSFFDIIAGKTKPNSGQILLDKQDITNLDELTRASSFTRIFQNTRLNSVGTLTVWQNLAIAQYSRRQVRLVDGLSAMDRNHACQIIHNLGLDESILDQPMQALSGGQRQLIAFAMATCQIPKILLLDEPTAALDPQAATKLLTHANKFIKQHQVTTLFITHDPQIALNIGNKIWILANGQISRIFNSSEKPNLKPSQLIGQIDYAKLSEI